MGVLTRLPAQPRIRNHSPQLHHSERPRVPRRAVGRGRDLGPRSSEHGHLLCRPLGPRLLQHGARHRGAALLHHLGRGRQPGRPGSHDPRQARSVPRAGHAQVRSPECSVPAEGASRRRRRRCRPLLGSRQMGAGLRERVARPRRDLESSSGVRRRGAPRRLERAAGLAPRPQLRLGTGRRPVRERRRRQPGHPPGHGRTPRQRIHGQQQKLGDGRWLHRHAHRGPRHLPVGLVRERHADAQHRPLRQQGGHPGRGRTRPHLGIERRLRQQVPRHRADRRGLGEHARGQRVVSQRPVPPQRGRDLSFGQSGKYSATQPASRQPGLRSPHRVRLEQLRLVPERLLEQRRQRVSHDRRQGRDPRVRCRVRKPHVRLLGPERLDRSPHLRLDRVQQRPPHQRVRSVGGRQLRLRVRLRLQPVLELDQPAACELRQLGLLVRVGVWRAERAGCADAAGGSAVREPGRGRLASAGRLARDRQRQLRRQLVARAGCGGQAAGGRSGGRQRRHRAREVRRSWRIRIRSGRPGAAGLRSGFGLDPGGQPAHGHGLRRGR